MSRLLEDIRGEDGGLLPIVLVGREAFVRGLWGGGKGDENCLGVWMFVQ